MAGAAVISRGISGHGEFAEDNERGALVAGLAVGIEDFRRVAGEVADGEIELRNRDLHRLARA